MTKFQKCKTILKWILKYNAKCAEMKYWKLRYTLLKVYGKK